MAAVTVNSVKYNVVGSLRQNIYNITGATAGTLVSGLMVIKQIIFDPGVITAASAAAPVNGMSTITFTSSGAYTAANVQLLGY